MTGAAQDVINGALSDVGASGGGTVTLMPGVYSITSGITVAADNVSLVGSGRDQTLIQAALGYPALSSPLVSVQGAHNVTIEGFTVDGHTNDVQANGIVATQSSGVSIADCGVLLSSSWNYGIWLVQSNDVQVERNLVDGVVPFLSQEGIETWNSSDVLIADNHILNIGSNGINLISAPTTLDGDIASEDGNINVIGNTVERTLDAVSVLLAGPRTLSGVTITNNVLRDLAGSGVHLSNYAAMSGAPADESATLAHPQELSDVLIEGNNISFNPAMSSLFGGAWYGNGITFDNFSEAGIFNAQGILAKDNDISGATIAFASFNYPSLEEADGPTTDPLAGTTQHVSGITGQPYTAMDVGYDDQGRSADQTLYGPRGRVYQRNTTDYAPDGSSATTTQGGAYFAHQPFFAFTDLFAPDGTPTEEDVFYKDGHQTVQGLVPGTTLHSITDDTFFAAPGGQNTFVFTPGFGHDTISNFVIGGGDHDTISLPSSAAGHLGAILAQATTDPFGSTVLHLRNDNTITIQGVSVVQLANHRGDFVFQG
ncbi:MAG: right-handed parallel beta-helix repeat-containing protein [Janthinobacterium lividum]